MAYQVYTITDITDVPAKIATFATAQGFTVDTTTADQPTVQHPTYADAEPFRFRTEVATPSSGIGASTYYKRLIIEAVNAGVATTTAIVESPRLYDGSTAIPFMPAPTKLHMFGGLTPEPYLAGVIEYGFNRYRHFYFGYAEKLSAYEGGEIIAGSAISAGNIAGSWYTFMDLSRVAYPFGARTGYWGSNGRNGGMRLVHENNPVSWRAFNKGSSSWSVNGLDADMTAYGDEVVLGGFGDSINDGYVVAGKSPYSGANVLSPVNLYIGTRSGSSQYFQAVGRPAGVRMVHMQDFDPGVEVTVGTSVWRVFPVFRKSADNVMWTAPADSPYWFLEESSNYAGYAYLVSE